MFITIDPGDRRPIYEQVADGIRELIAGGALAEGAALPPVRQIAADLGVNLNTIATAYRLLAEEGLIQVRHGQRALVASRRAASGDSGDLRRKLRSVLAQLILAGLGEDEVLEAVTDELHVMDPKGQKAR